MLPTGGVMLPNWCNAPSQVGLYGGMWCISAEWVCTSWARFSTSQCGDGQPHLGLLEVDST